MCRCYRAMRTSTWAPRSVEIGFSDLLPDQDLPTGTPVTFTVAISTEPETLNNAAKRLLGLSQPEVEARAREAILVSMRLLLATKSGGEINQDREGFLALVNEGVGAEVKKIGLELVHANIPWNRL